MYCADTNQTWPVYGQKFGKPTISSTRFEDPGGDYLISANCRILAWPCQPNSSQLTGIDIVLWIEGRDSAGWEIEAGGPTVGLDGIEELAEFI